MASPTDITEPSEVGDIGTEYEVDDYQNCDTALPKSSKKKHKSKKSSTRKNNADVGTGDVGTGENDELFHVISNPQKMLPKPRKSTHKGDKKKKKKKKRRDSSVASMSSLSDYSSDGVMSSIGAGSFCSGVSNGSYQDNYDEADHASNGDDCSLKEGCGGLGRRRNEEIMQEKEEMLTRISKMSKQGFATTRRWSVRDDIDEIRFECYRMTRESNSKKAVKSMQHGLITLATILEFANSVFNPFNLKLNGFSKNMMLTVSDYDDSLEAIHHKWSGKAAIGPELTVLFTFASSAVFHHAGNVSNSPAPPTSRQQGSANKMGGGMGLGDMSSMLALFSSMAPKGGGSQEPKQPHLDQKPKQRRPMKGPSPLPTASMSLP